MEANLAYYQGLAHLGLGYLKSLADIVGGVSSVPIQVRSGHEHSPAAPTGEAARQAAAPERATPPNSPAMVLEAEAGGEALGVFLVENRLDRKVSAPVTPSSFSDPSGRQVTPALRIDPEVMTLEPGEQMLVRVAARIADDLEPGISYRGEVTVPELSGGRVPLVLRRRVGQAAEAPKPEPKGGPRPKKPSPRSTRTTGKTSGPRPGRTGTR